MTKKICILGGGTNTYISNHLALSAPAYGTTAKALKKKFETHDDNKMQVDLYLTKMAGGRSTESLAYSLEYNEEKLKDPSLSSSHRKVMTERAEYYRNALKHQGIFDTPEDIEVLVDNLIADPNTRVIVFNVAMVDYKPDTLYTERPVAEGVDTKVLTKLFGKYTGRLSTSENPYITLELSVQDKIIQKIRKERKDILLVGFKTTCGATKTEQFNKGLKLCKDASANIVFVNDVDKNRIEALNQHLAAKTDKVLQQSINRLDIHHLDNLNIEQVLKINNTRYEFLNDTAIERLQNNGLVTPEESSYWYNTRDEALDGLVQMVLDRSHLHFTRSTVVDSETVPWNIPTLKISPKNYVCIKEDTDISKGEVIQMPNSIIPETFRTVFDWVRSQGAYKQGPTGSTVGHFGIKLGPNEFLTSKRKTDFNKMEEVGLVRVITDDPDNVFGYKHFFMSESEKEYEYWKDCLKNPNSEILSMPPLQIGIREDKVIAFGAKPSVGGQSQRSLFDAFPDLDCIVHFHCPLKLKSRELFTTTPQFPYECGSRECITSCITGFKEYKVSETHSIWAGHMDYHGPNIVFSKDIDPQLVINFINSHWDLSKKTTGLSSELI